MLFRIAWRSLRRNRRRTLLVVAAIAFAGSLTITKMSVDYGTLSEGISEAARLSTGFIQIQKPGYIDNPSLEKNFSLSPAITHAIDRIPGVSGSSPRVQADGLLSHKEHSIGAMVMGVSPKTEGEITDFALKVSTGRFLSADSSAHDSMPEIVVGYRLLKNLKASVGDSVVLLCQGYDGVLSNMFVRIIGAFMTGSDEFDRMGAFMNIKELQSFLSMDGRVNAVAISVRNIEDVPEVTRQLESSLKPLGLVAVPWQTLMPQMKQTLEFKQSGDLVFMGILLLVVGFGILNAVLMSITERFREYGVVLALGMRPGKLAATVAIESLLMLIIGLVLGDLAGFGASYYFHVHPIVVGGNLADLYRQYGFNVPIITSSMTSGIFVLASICILSISFISTLYPLWRVLRLEPLKGIRYT